MPGPRRKSERVVLDAEIGFRRAGSISYRVKIRDASPNGCRAEFVVRPVLGETVWIKFDGLETIESHVRWLQGFEVGLEFARPLHPAIFSALVSKLS